MTEQSQPNPTEANAERGMALDKTAGNLEAAVANMTATGERIRNLESAKAPAAQATDTGKPAPHEAPARAERGEIWESEPHIVGHIRAEILRLQEPETEAGPDQVQESEAETGKESRQSVSATAMSKRLIGFARSKAEAFGLPDDFEAIKELAQQKGGKIQKQYEWLKPFVDAAHVLESDNLDISFTPVRIEDRGTYNNYTQEGLLPLFKVGDREERIFAACSVGKGIDVELGKEHKVQRITRLNIDRNGYLYAKIKLVGVESYKKLRTDPVSGVQDSQVIQIAPPAPVAPTPKEAPAPAPAVLAARAEEPQAFGFDMPTFEFAKPAEIAAEVSPIEGLTEEEILETAKLFNDVLSQPDGRAAQELVDKIKLRFEEEARLLDEHLKAARQISPKTMPGIEQIIAHSEESKVKIQKLAQIKAGTISVALFTGIRTGKFKGLSLPANAERFINTAIEYMPIAYQILDASERLAQKGV